MSIYGKAMEIAELQEKLEDSIDLETGEIDTELMNALAVKDEEFKGKAVALRNWTLNLENDCKGIDEEIKRLQAIKKSKKNLSDRIKTSIVAAMRAAGLDKIETPTITISYQKSEETIIDQEAFIPDEYMIAKTTYTPDKTKIKAAIKAGREVPGAYISPNYNFKAR